jgi:cytochrome c556
MIVNVNRAVAPVTALSVLIVTIAVRAGQTTIAKPLIPVAASTLADRPETYVGQVVTVTGAVEQTLSKSVFSIDQDKTKSTGKYVLVIAPSLNGPVGLNTYVTVVGEVVRFSAGEITQRLPQYVLDLPTGLVSKYEGVPTVLATAVVDTALVDLARKVPPPLTPEEEAFDKVMKAAGPAFTALRQALTDTDAPTVKTQAGILRQAFSDAQVFWKRKGRTDAVGWATDAREHVDTIQRSAQKNDWDAAQASASSLGKMCQNCHGAYRERLDDGTYRLKAIPR